MPQKGDITCDLKKGTTVQILDVCTSWGFETCTVIDCSTHEVYTTNAANLSTTNLKTELSINDIRLLAITSKIQNQIHQGIISSISTKIIPLPHQLHVLKRVVNSDNVRFILADEVGLGKTIEAGLIIKELKARNLIKRILIVCPTGLVTQWQIEMQEKFSEFFNIILPEQYDTIRNITNTNNVYDQFSQVISPMDSIKPLERRSGWSEEKILSYNQDRILSIINANWDIIIIDEAHRVAGSSGEVARHKLGRILSESSPYLLLLSATPHNGKTDSFLRLIRLLDKASFPNENAITKDQVSKFLIRTEKREAIDNDGRPLFKKRNTHIMELHWDERHSFQKELYFLVTNYVSNNYNRAKKLNKSVCIIFLLIMMQRLVTSSTRAIRLSLEKRIFALQNGITADISQQDIFSMSPDDTEFEEFQSIDNDLQSEITELRNMVSVAKQAEYQYPDVKIEKLIDILDEIRSVNKKRKVIIFTEFISTQEYIKEKLIKNTYSVSLLNGQMSIDERNEVLDEFKNVSDVLISTDAGGEGLNLQFSSCVINYDLPWNPMKIEQRIGRVDRIGQTEDVDVFNFVLADTIENRVREVLESKLSTILNEMGIDKYADILDGEMSEINYTDAYLNSIGDNCDIELNIRPIEDDLRQQIENANGIKDLIHEDKDLLSLVGSRADFNLEALLQKMVYYYYLSIDKPIKHFTEYTLENPEIAHILNHTIVLDSINMIPSISVEDHSLEPGYFMLWEMALESKSNYSKVVPIFINHVGEIRPMTGIVIWDILSTESEVIIENEPIKIDTETINHLRTLSTDYSYDLFMDLKSEYERRISEIYSKQSYALRIREQSASKIGIENIRKSKLSEIQREKDSVDRQFNDSKDISPRFILKMLVAVE